MTLSGSSSAATPMRLFEPGDFRRPFLILWAIFILFYFSELTDFSLSIDDEKALFRNDPAVFVGEDRWLLYVIERFLLPPPVMPFFPLFVFGGLASLGYIVVARRHEYDLGGLAGAAAVRAVQRVSRAVLRARFLFRDATGQRVHPCCVRSRKCPYGRRRARCAWWDGTVLVRLGERPGRGQAMEEP